ncbi:GntR family transcriptional regulator [Cognatishimia sp. F0-27]|uniref:GntR family transcriptional regulator n=1 Tax=Cognatishimia sp. F0-27 TaxID=2816855 RepID=UPI001D0C7DBF|nr:GntR family transcriptional regulator [Cognatishimia sp. F0-27]MCC1492857.1 GntR family transcriptional regulator [Cognatishimia sp. F0-27]
MSRKDACFDSLVTRILAMDLQPGLDLDEASLASHYGLSRTPLREVLQRLSGAGYVTISENRGAKVASMDITVMRVFFQTAPMIYANVMQLAARCRTTAQLDRLKDAQRAFKSAGLEGEAQDMALANHRFHAITLEMADNPYLGAAMNRLLIDHTRLSQTFYRPSSADDAALVATAIEQHDAMIAAIEAREGALAIDLTLQHWDLSRDRMERFVRPDPLPVDVLSMKGRRHAF